MAAKDRKLQLLNIIKDRNFTNTHELHKELKISRATLHRYLRDLSQENLIKIVRSGIIFIGKDENSLPALSDYELKQDPLYEERQRIGKAAVELVKNQESIILGTGRTTFALAKYLRQSKKNVFVFTASLAIAYLLKDSTCKVTVISGTAMGEEGYLVGPSAIQSARSIFTQKAFIGAGGVSIENGVANHDSLIVEVEKELLKNVKEVILLTSHTKFGQSAPYVVTPLNKITTVITGRNISQEYLRYFEKNNSKVILVL